MNVTGTTVSVSVVTLVLGSLLGAWYGTHHFQNPSAKQTPGAAAHKGSNYIRMEIRPGTKVAVVAPQVGDLVEWYPQATNANPHPAPAIVQFQGTPPCDGHGQNDPLSSCLVNTHGNFEFDCVRPVCVDPGMDPRSQTGTVLLAKPGAGPSVTPIPTITNGPPDLPTIMISCDPSQTPIVPKGKDPINAYQQQQISWVAGAVSDFIINVPPKFCMEDATGTGHIQADNTAVCTVAANADTKTPTNYSVSGACNGNKTGNFTINLSKWPLTK
jgi:hypothetical protein